MTSILAIVAWSTAVACVAASFVQWRRTGRGCLGAPRMALQMLSRGERPAGGPQPPPDRAWQLVSEVLAVPPGRARVATLNERLLVIERLTDDVLSLPRAGARIALFTGLGCAVLAVARMPSETANVVVALCSACAGVAGAGFCGYLGRRAGRSARDARSDYNRLADRLMKGSLALNPPSPAPRS